MRRADERHAQLLPPAAAQAAPSRRRPDNYRFPTWWFVVLSLPYFMPMLIGTAFVTVVWPVAIGRMAGYRDKALMYAAVGQVGNVLGWTSPFIGALSDRTPPWIARRFGRRRPFVAAGGACHLLGDILVYVAVSWLDEPSLLLLGVALVLKNIGLIIEGAAFSAIIPETVPLEQRGLSITIMSWLVAVFALAGSGIAWILGEGIFPWISTESIWRGNIFMVGLNVPLQLIACNGEAGWWKPEHTSVVMEPPAAVGEPAERCCGLVAAVRDFIGSFRLSPTYRNYWIFLAVNSFASMIDTSFTFFWLQDCFTEFRFFGVQVASNAKAAQGILGALGSFVPIFAISLLRPHKWRERFGGRQVVLWSSLLLYFARPFSFVIWQGEFSVVLLWAVFQGVTLNGLAVAAVGALPMDCLPADEDGKPLRPAQDLNFYNWGGLLTGLGFPILLGDSVSWFPTHRDAYAMYWIVGGSFGIVAYAILALLVHPQEEPLEKTCQCTRHWYRKAFDDRRRKRRQREQAGPVVGDGDELAGAGVGALLCDRLLFPSQAKGRRNLDE